MTVHDFEGELSYSQDADREAWWQAYYRTIWPNLLWASLVPGGNRLQRDGVDRIVQLPSGRVFTVDEKVRRGQRTDFLAELWSVYYGPRNTRNKLGWTVDDDKVCDYVAYFVEGLRRAYLLPFDLLRRTAKRRIRQWRTLRPQPRPARNDGYVTVNVAVDWDRLFADMAAEQVSSPEAP